MHRVFFVNLILIVLIPCSRGVQASPLQLLSYESGIDFTQKSPLDHALFFSMLTPLDFDYGLKGGSTSFNVGDITAGPSDGLAIPDISLTGGFHFNFRVSSKDPSAPFADPEISISGPLSGTLYSGVGQTFVRYGGTFSGTATSASFGFPGTSQDISELPLALLDVLNHPDHLHFKFFVTGGGQNELMATLTFDAPSPVPTPVPEPTTLLIFTVGAAALLHYRHSSKNR